MKTKLLMIMILLTGFGLNAISQNFTITAQELKAIRILSNKAERDSSLLENCKQKNDTLMLLNNTIKLQNAYLKEDSNNLKQIIHKKNTQITQIKTQNNTEKKILKRKILFRNVIITFQIIFNTYLIFRK